MMSPQDHQSVLALYRAAREGEHALARVLAGLRHQPQWPQLAVHVQQASQLCQQFDALRTQNALLHSRLEDYPAPLLAMTRFGELRFANRAARALAQRSVLFTWQDGVLHWLQAQNAERVARALRHIERGSVIQQTLQLVAAESDSGLLLASLSCFEFEFLMPLDLEQHESTLDDALFWLGLHQLRLSERHLDLVQQRLALTPTERQMAALLIQGSSLKQIAATRFVSETTVRKQMQTLLRKLDCHSQEMLSQHLFETALRCWVSGSPM